MNFCLQCGAALPQIVINLQNDPPPTQIYREAPPTNPDGRKETEGFGNNRANFSPNFATQQPPPPRPRSNAKIFLILGGVFALFLLLVVAGVAIVGYNIMTSPKTVANNNTATPVPTRTVNTINTPVPFGSSTPVVVPSANPNTTPAVTPAVKSPTDPNGKIERTWVDYNITDNERTGMRIHNKFRTFNLKDTECYLAIYFQTEDGTRLKSSDPTFRAQNGDLALFRLLKPNYDSTVYDDIVLFMPYGEFDVQPGKHRLKLDVDLITKEGQLIQHLNFHNFEYERFAK